MSNQPDKTQLPAKTAERPVDLKGLINSPAIREQVARALPRHLTADRFLRVATTTLLRVPKLAQCTQASFMRAMLDCSSLGLEPDGRRAHLIPYGQECQLIIDYKGLIELAKRSGDVASWKAETVKERDEFEWENGNVTHKINWREDRGALQCVYSIVHLKDGDVDTEVMTLKEVEAIRKRSRAGNSGPWVTDFEEMAKKTVIRRHSKRLTLSPEFSDALDRDADSIPFDEIAEGGSKKNTRYQAGRFQPPQIDATEVIDEGDAQPQSESANNEQQAVAPAEQQPQVVETKQALAPKAKPAFQPKTQSPAARTAKPVQQQPEPEPTSEPEEDPDQNGDGDDNLFGEA